MGPAFNLMAEKTSTPNIAIHGGKALTPIATQNRVRP